MIDIEQILNQQFKHVSDKKWFRLMVKLLKHLIHQDEINQFIEKNQHLRGFAFLDEILNYFDFTYQVSNRSLHRIPAEGRVVIVANHPIGSMDGLALLKLVRSVRADVRIVANQMLSHIEPLQSLFFPVDNLSRRATHKTQYKQMLAALDSDEAVIIFPAGEVSRIRPNGVRDGQWKTGFLKLAKKTHAPILPIYINASNSALFYSVSALFKPLSTLMLVQEMFNKNNKECRFHVGKPVAWKDIDKLDMGYDQLASRFRRHLFRLGKSKLKQHSNKERKPLFDTYETVVHPVSRSLLKRQLYKSELLGETADGKKIFLHDAQENDVVLTEVGRLRELTFRTVEEGTGGKIDIDKYDRYYRHIILWDDSDLEIVGAYRVGEGSRILRQLGLKGLYTTTLFDFSASLQNLLPQSLELGRSFVQPRYWGRRSLDYLWYGIGAYLRNHPEIRYLFGPVSLSNAYPAASKELIVSFYQHQFGSSQALAKPLMPFELSRETRAFAAQRFSADYKTGFETLNRELERYGVKVPTLYKQYSELCDDRGCEFLAFNIDPEFNYCVDSLILVDLDKVKIKKRQRYIGEIVDQQQAVA